MAKPGRSRESENDERARIALKPIKQVVVGTSLQEGSDEIVRAARDVARSVDGRLTLVHSLAADAMVPAFGTGWPDADFYRSWSEMQKAELGAQIERVGIAVPMAYRVESGAPHRVIADAAQETGADLIVIGASDRGRLTRFLGGTADRVLRRAQCPVLVIRGDWTFPIERVLIPVDFSLLSGEALDCGLSFLFQIGSQEPQVELFYAVSEPLRALAEPFTAGQVEKFASQELERFGRESAGECSVDLSYQVAVGGAASEILREADRFEADLVVVGTNGQGGVERALLGSVAKAVATESGRPVLFIPPDVAIGASVAEAVLEQTEPRWEAVGEGVEAVAKSGAT